MGIRISDLPRLITKIYAAYTILANSKRLYLLTGAVTPGQTTTGAPAGSMGLTSNSTGANKLLVSNGTVWLDAGLGHQVYRAVVAQAGTAAPTATVIENSLDGAPTLARTGAGVYTITRASAFTANKTFIRATLDGGATAVLVKAARTSANVITVTTYDISGAAADLVGSLYLEICVNP
jgi:hypothetical protein